MYTHPKSGVAPQVGPMQRPTLEPSQPLANKSQVSRDAYWAIKGGEMKNHLS